MGVVESYFDLIARFHVVDVVVEVWLKNMLAHGSDCSTSQNILGGWDVGLVMNSTVIRLKIFITST